MDYPRNLPPITTRHRQRRPYLDQVRQAGSRRWLDDGVEGMASRAQTSRRCPAASVTAPVHTGTTAARTEEDSRDKSRSLTNGDTTRTSVRQLLCRTLDSAASLTDGSTSALPSHRFVRHTLSEISLRQLQQATTVATVVHHN